VPCLLNCLDMKTEAEFRDGYLRTIEGVLESGPPARGPDWSGAVAVGDEVWVQRLAGRVTPGRCQVTPLAAATPLDPRAAAGSYALRPRWKNCELQRHAAMSAPFTGRLRPRHRAA
jgi:hypothetical protein